MADGKVIIETGLDITGATKDLNNLGKTIEKEGKEIPPIKPEVKPEVEEKAKTKTKADINSLVEEVNRILKNAKTDVNINVSDEDLNIVSSRIDAILSNTQLVTSEKVKKINAEFKKIGLTGVGENVQKNVADKVEQGMNKTATATNKTTQATNKATKASKNLDKETKDLNKDLKQVGATGAKSMQQISSGANKSSKSIGGLKASLGKIAGILAAGFSIQAIVNMGKEAVNLASDLTEVQNVVDTAFGSMSQKMEDFADTAIETYGISKLTAKNIGSTYTAMARGMGQSLDEATDKALEMTGRVADIASFYNLTIDRANTIGRAVYSGETEPLKQIGVIMTEDQLAAFALANGYDTLYKNMNAAQKLEVRQAYFLSQTNLAAGDFVKTQDSWANQTKILSERWKEFLSVLGTGLIQILAPVLKFLNQFVSAMTSALTAFNKFLGINTEVSATGAAGIADIADSMDDVTSSTEAATDAQKDLLGSYDKLNVISKDTSSGATGAGGGAGAGGLDITETVDEDKTKFLDSQVGKMKKILDGFSNYVKTNFGDTFRNIGTDMKNNMSNTKTIFSGILEDIKALIPPFINYLNTDFPTMINTALATAGNVINGTWDSPNLVLSTTWDSYIYPILSKFITVGLPVLTQFETEAIDTFNTLFNVVKNIFDTLWTEGIVPFLTLLSTVWTGVMDIVANLWEEHGQPIFEGIKTAIQEIGDTILNIWDTILKPIWSTLISALAELWTEHIAPLLEKFGGFVAKLIELGLLIYNKFILPIINWFVDMFGPAIGSAISTAIEVISNIIGPIMDVVADIFSIFGGVIDFITGILTGDWEQAWQGIVDIFGGIWDTIVDVIKAPLNLVIGLINGLLTAIETGVNFVIRAVNKLSFDVPNWVPGIGGETFGFDLDETSFTKIPYLASGAVIPPNKEFMAVLGDQSSGTNIETPLKTMMEAFNAALDARGGSSHEPIILQLPNGKVIAELVWSEEEKRYKQTGSYRPKYS
uniref:Minor tail protein n=1 Tax=Siphoviridae sp. ctwDi18 TaxID=2827970 RepID=A0A8S5T9F9_9CAUD|nr:MAG TPA: minor tail protein [Siphoviridae sp. ctwDi18]